MKFKLLYLFIASIFCIAHMGKDAQGVRIFS